MGERERERERAICVCLPATSTVLAKEYTASEV